MQIRTTVNGTEVTEDVGGSTDPSGWNDGSALGATTPGISASCLSTCVPCTPYRASQILRT